MDIFDYLVLVILFILPIIIFHFKYEKTGTRFSFYAHTVIGVFFAFTYFAFVNWHTSWYLFSDLHVYGLIATLILPFALAYLVKGTGMEKNVAIVMALILFLSPITRPFLLVGPFSLMRNGYYRTAIIHFEYAIPLNICNISAIIYLFALLLPAQGKVANVIKGYMITIGFFGGLVNNIQTHNDHVDYFWYYFNWESYIVHALIMIIPIYMVLTKQIEVKFKDQLWNLAWLIPGFFFMGFVLNPWFGFNFWFTQPIEFMSFLPQNFYLTIFGSSVYPLYMVLLLLLVLIACTLLYFGFDWLSQKVMPYFIETDEKEECSSNFEVKMT